MTPVQDLGEEGEVILAAEQIKLANDNLTENAVKVLEEATKVCADAGVKADSIVATGNPRDKLVDIAKERHIDMIVIGSRGLGTLSRCALISVNSWISNIFLRLLLGSVSDYIVKNAPCSVLVIRDNHKSTSSSV